MNKFDQLGQWGEPYKAQTMTQKYLRVESVVKGVTVPLKRYGLLHHIYRHWLFWKHHPHQDSASQFPIIALPNPGDELFIGHL